MSTLTNHQQFHKKKLIVENGKEHDLLVSPKRVPSSAIQTLCHIKQLEAQKLLPSANPPSYWQTGSPAAAAKRTREVCDELYWAAIERGEDQLVAATSNSRSLSLERKKGQSVSSVGHGRKRSVDIVSEASPASSLSNSNNYNDRKNQNMMILGHVNGGTCLPLSGGVVAPNIRNAASDMVTLALRGRAQWENEQQERKRIMAIAEAKKSRGFSRPTSALSGATNNHTSNLSRPGTAGTTVSSKYARPMSAALSTTSTNNNNNNNYNGDQFSLPSARPTRPLSAASVATIEHFKRRALSPSDDSVVLSSAIKSNNINSSNSNNVNSPTKSRSLNTSQMSGDDSIASTGHSGNNNASGCVVASKMGNGQSLYQGPDRLYSLTPHRDRWRDFDKSFNGSAVASRDIAEFERRLNQNKKFKEKMENMKREQATPR